MGDRTQIEWSDATWNPTTGCDRVSEGCDHCYALTLAGRLKAMGNPRYQRDGDPRRSGPGFGLTLHADQLDLPLRWKKPRMVFVDSMSDLFHADVPDEFIAQVFEVMGSARHHTFQVLTKRPGRMASLLRRWGGGGWRGLDYSMPPVDVDLSWPLPNVWLGTSVETQKWADVRIPKLLETPAAVRFLSCEPLLGEISLRHHLRWFVERGRRYPNPPLAHKFTSSNPAVGGGLCAYCALGERLHHSIDWVIVGGESGPGARPMHPDWARSLRDQCVSAGVPFFFKQWGEWWPGLGPPGGNALTHGHFCADGQWINRSADTASGIHMARVGKKGAGRMLDGRTWDEMPQRAT